MTTEQKQVLAEEKANAKAIAVGDWTSRKYRAAWKLTGLFTVLFVVPRAVAWLLSVVDGDHSFDLLPVEFYTTLVGGVWLGYFGANVVEKHKAFDKEDKTLKQNGNGYAVGYSTVVSMQPVPPGYQPTASTAALPAATVVNTDSAGQPPGTDNR